MQSIFGTIIGVGQCGSRIAKSFATSNLVEYPIYLINSDELDVSGLSIESNKCLMVHSEGTGSSTVRGYELGEKNKSQLIKFLKEIRKTHGEKVLLIGGAGGGTGGGLIPYIISLSQEYDIFSAIGVLLTLPVKVLDILAMSNAMKTLRMVSKLKPSYVILADNQYMLDNCGVGSHAFWENVNMRIVSHLNAVDLITDSSKTSVSGFASIDRAEVERILFTGKGLVDISTTFISNNVLPLLTEENKIQNDSLFSSMLIQGLEYSKSLSYLCCIDVLRGTISSYNHAALQIFELMKKKHGQAINRFGVFESRLVSYGGIQVTRLTSGLAYPKIIQSKLKNLKRDETRFSSKRELDRSLELDDSGLLDLDE